MLEERPVRGTCLNQRSTGTARIIVYICAVVKSEPLHMLVDFYLSFVAFAV